MLLRLGHVKGHARRPAAQRTQTCVYGTEGGHEWRRHGHNYKFPGEPSLSRTKLLHYSCLVLCSRRCDADSYESLRRGG